MNKPSGLVSAKKVAAAAARALINWHESCTTALSAQNAKVTRALQREREREKGEARLAYGAASKA